MKAFSKSGTQHAKVVHYGRFILAFFALLVAATHLASTSGSSGGGGSAPHIPSNQVSTSTTSSTGLSGGSNFGFSALGLWLDIEVIAYTIIAVVWLLGLRTWYPAMVVFNAFNVVLYFLSGLIPIPGITGMIFASHFSIFSSLSTSVLVISWIASLILGLVLLKYDKGSEIDRLLVTHRD